MKIFPSLSATLLSAVLLALPGAAFGQQVPLTVHVSPAGTQLEHAGAVFHSTAAEVRDARLVEVPSSDQVVALWEERAGNDWLPFYAISLDGQSFATIKQTSYELMLRLERFDPLERVPDFSRSPLQADVGVHIVQYVTQPLAGYTEHLRSLGATVHAYLPYHANLVSMAPAVLEEVRQLPFVRWIGAYHPEYRLADELLAGLRAGALPEARYLLRTFESGITQKESVADVIRILGGSIDELVPDGFLFQATLTLEQLAIVVSLDEVQFVDLWGPPEDDMDIAREFSGANALELATGFTGQGVRGEVMDGGVRQTHNAFTGNGGILLHGPNGGSSSHGTSTTSAVFAAGPAGIRGGLPNISGGGQIVFATYSGLSNRKAHTLQLTNPSLTYRCVFQSNSWGSSTTKSYNNFSAGMDDIIFDADLVILQSQSNTATQFSRPEAWAKNIVSVGGINHFGTLSDLDDSISSASHGPAEDGRIKPDLAHFYDGVATASSNCDTCTTTSFGGTSAATPITAGHFGIFHQLWHENAFGNGASGATVFDSRPHFETAKAAMINTAVQWRGDQSSWIARERQGWGRVDVESLHGLRDETFVVNREMISNLETQAYTLVVPADSPALRVTLVYRDLAGVTSSSMHRINDLTLRVVSPSGTVYWGNFGLHVGRWSVPDGVPTDRDTVENVFVRMPEAGAWLVEVIGDDINTDLPAYTGTPGNQADFSLWVTGVVPECEGGAVVYCASQANTNLCLPAISGSGSASATAGSGFVIEATGVISGNPGLLFYSKTGEASMPFQNGTLCLASPTTRTPVQLASTAAGCEAKFSFDFNAWIAGGMDPDLTAGTTVWAQYWSRDVNDSFGSNFTDAVRFTICQ